MRVLVGYAPLISDKGVPLLSQNRQFQWFSKPTYVYPMVPASAATMLKESGHEILWLDGIAEELTEEEFIKRFVEFSPELFLTETKTPVVELSLGIISRLKEACPTCKMVLCGDHVTALPSDTMSSCDSLDFIITGGDYDFLVLKLVKALSGGDAIPQGIWYRKDGQIIDGGKFHNCENDLNTLPHIDRDLTKWFLYSKENGNFRSTPGTYIMSGRDCWWGKCKFCSWTTLYPEWRIRAAKDVLDEIGEIIEKYHVKEIFDDTGALPGGAWLKEFCEGMISRGYNKKVVLGCNMIPGILTKEQYQLMSKAGFRFVLFGLESASESTLDRINKCPSAKKIEESMKWAHEAGLKPHVTCMVGYPWESLDEAKKTIAMTRSLFDKGWIDTLQGTIVIPYPGTPLFRECEQNNWLRTKDWSRYDMREPIMKTSMSDDEIMGLIRGLYTSFLSPKFIIRQIKSIRKWSDFVFLWRAGLRVIGHLLDFHSKKTQ